MRKILYRPKGSPKGTPFREGYVVYEGRFAKIASYRGSVWTTTYLTDELEIIELE